MNPIQLIPVPVTLSTLQDLESRGLIRLFHPTEATLRPPNGENITEALYESAPGFGPHRLIAVGVNKQGVRLGTHSDHEEFLIPPHGTEVKPLYLVISYLKAAELLTRDQAGLLAADDFICLSLYPSPRGAEMFTMLPGTVHCELTDPGEEPVGTFFVTEPRDLDVQWIDLELTGFNLKK